MRRCVSRRVGVLGLLAVPFVLAMLAGYAGAAWFYHYCDPLSMGGSCPATCTDSRCTLGGGVCTTPGFGPYKSCLPGAYLYCSEPVTCYGTCLVGGDRCYCYTPRGTC